MQVPSIKSDSFTEQSTDSDASTITSSVAFATLMTCSDKDNAVASDFSSLNQSTTKEDKSTDTTQDDATQNTLMTDLSQQVNFYIGQIDMAKQPNQITNDEATSDLTQDNLSALSSSAMSAKQNISDNTFNENAKAPQNTDVSTIDKQEADNSLATSLMDHTTEDDSSEKSVADNTKQKTEVSKESSEVNAMQNAAFTNPALQTVALNSAPKESFSATKENKYTESLNTLGSLINGLTSQQANLMQEPAQRLTASLPDTASLSYADALKRATQPDFTSSVELLPPSLDAQLNDIYNANIRIYPPELGHVLAKLRIDKNNAEVTITAENSTVKAIIESNLTQLREHFHNADINVTNIQVDVAKADDKQQKNNQNHQFSSMSEQNNSDSEVVNEDRDQMLSKKTLNSMIDTYV